MVNFATAKAEELP